MPKPGTLFIAVVLFGIILLAVFRPEPMLAPGPVKPAHAAIVDDCFACHAPFKGAAADRCITCHAPARIGLFTTKGKRLAGGKAAFHQQLITPDCLACHTDHAGPALTGHSPVRFHHDLLKPAVRGQCATCHVAPATTLHRQFASTGCTTCHVGGNTRRYTCYGCHEHKPAATLAEHREEGVRGNIDNCARCHRSAEGEREGGEDDE